MSIQSSTATNPAFAGPLYVQVAGILRDKICASQWTSRAPLPNEVSLARDIGVSIGTVRKALEMLENERLIQRRQGRGTFVVDTSDETERERFSNVVLDSKKLHADRLRWSYSLCDASSAEAGVLKLQPAAKVYKLEAVWTAGAIVSAVESVVVAEARFPKLHEYLSEAGQFLFPVYRRHYQEVVCRVTESVTSVNADIAVAEKLKVRKDQAVLCIDRVAFGIGGAPIEWSRRTMHLTQAAYNVTMS